MAVDLRVASLSDRTVSSTMTQFSVTLDRPMFSPSRRPAPPPAVNVVASLAEPDPMDTLQLVGVFSEGSGAGVLARVEGKVRRLRTGENFGQWQLQGVQGRNATFVSGDQTRVLRLVHSRPSGSDQSAAKNIAPQNSTLTRSLPAPGTADFAAMQREEARERIRRVNETLSKAGLPLQKFE
jgi:hypothetical protein